MKIIDLLNKIANREIDYTNMFDAGVGMGYCDINEYFEKYPINENYLNVEIIELLPMSDEVEIIEKKKIPEKIDIYVEDNEKWIQVYNYGAIPLDKKPLSNEELVIIKTLNQLIDYFKSKGE